MTRLSSMFPDHGMVDAFLVLPPKHQQLMSNEEQEPRLDIIFDKYTGIICPDGSPNRIEYAQICVQQGVTKYMKERYV